MPATSAGMTWQCLRSKHTRWSIMNGRAFKLGTFSKAGGQPFAAIVLDDVAVDLAQAVAASGRKLGTTASIQGLLDDWDRNFATLQEIAAFLDKDGAKTGASVTSLTA